MAILGFPDLITAVQSRVTGQSDDDISFLENFQDTINDLQSKIGEDWKSKYEENDREWRERYISRFQSGGTPSNAAPEPTTTPPIEPEPPKNPYEDITIDSLFKKKG